MRWSVGIEAEGDRIFSREEIVELADAVAASSGIATGIGTNRYGARLLVVADSRDDAIAAATASSRLSATTSSRAPYWRVPMPVATPLLAATASASSTTSSRVKTRSPSASMPTLHLTDALLFA